MEFIQISQKLHSKNTVHFLENVKMFELFKMLKALSFIMYDAYILYLNSCEQNELCHIALVVCILFKYFLNTKKKRIIRSDKTISNNELRTDTLDIKSSEFQTSSIPRRYVCMNIV